MINVFGANLGPAEIAAATECLTNSWMGMGRKVKQFEDELWRHMSLFPKSDEDGGVVMTDSGSNALLLAMKLLDLQPGSEVILPSFTWVACANAILLAGCVPVFADVDPNTQNITVKDVCRVLSSRTKAIMVVHYAGKPVHIEDFTFCLPVISDAAHAVDSSYKGWHCGYTSTVGVLSFDAIKNIATPEGGAVVCGDPEMERKARELRYCGIDKAGFSSIETKDRWWEYDIKHVWHKMLPNDMSASIGLTQLHRLGELQGRRKAIWDRYQKELDVSWLANPIGPEREEKHSYFTYFVRVLDGNRDRLAKYLLENGIYTTLRYHPLHLNPIYDSNVRLPVCELLNEQGINLPLHPSLSDDDVSKVIETVKRCPR